MAEQTKKKKYRYCSWPKGSRPQDKFACIAVNCPKDCDCIYVKIGAQRGDYLITYLTTDILEGDIVHAVEVADDESIAVGEVHFTRAGFEIDGDYYSQAEVKIKGRIVEIQRKGVRVKPNIKLPAIHRRKKTTKTLRAVFCAIEAELNRLEPKFSIQDRRLMISYEKGAN